MVVRSGATVDLVFKRIVDALGADIEKYRKSPNESSIYFKDGTRILWVKPNGGSKGNRFSYGVIENGVKEEILNNIIYPCFAGCEKDEVFFIEDVESAVVAIREILERIREQKYEVADLDI